MFSVVLDNIIAWEQSVLKKECWLKLVAEESEMFKTLHMHSEYF